MSSQVKVKITNTSKNLLPSYQTEMASGLDIQANIEREITMSPMDRRLIPTGIFLEIPAGLECQIRPRSGLAWKKGLTLVNSPGTIDADYRGEVKVLMINLSKEVQTILPSERIAQLIFGTFEKIEWQHVSQLSETERGSGGFGSTGT